MHLFMSTTWLEMEKAVLVQVQVLADIFVRADLKDIDIESQTATAL
jgi:hypothetical protein